VAEQQQKSAKDLPPIAVSSSSQGKSLAKLLYLVEMATLQQLHRRQVLLHQEHTPDTTKR